MKDQGSSGFESGLKMVFLLFCIEPTLSWFRPSGVKTMNPLGRCEQCQREAEVLTIYGHWLCLGCVKAELWPRKDYLHSTQ